MEKPKVGLLALYLKLYDDTQAWLRRDVEEFKGEIEKKLGNHATVVSHGICRLEEEIAQAVKQFEEAGVDAIVTLHLSYSPSLECCRVLAKTRLPLLVLDTTPDFSFDPVSGDRRIMQNHGIHGVQDMCSVLRRNGVEYWVFAGHHEKSDVLERIGWAARGAMMAARMGNSRIGRVGESFVGMGDFLVEKAALEKLGISVVPFDFDSGLKRLEAVTGEEIDREWEADQKRFNVQELSRDCYRSSARVGLALRKWIEEEGLDGVTVNFLATDQNPALPLMPFLELCKCMERGTGYAGEGDVLNAAFVAALMKGFARTTFAEMFCPHWEGDSVFLSHMGEFNPAVADQPILLTELEFTYARAGNPATPYGCLSGCDKAGFVNLNPIADGQYVLIAAPGKMLSVREAATDINRTVRGWFRPQVPLPDFLEQYSRLGGGHHGAVVYDMELEVLESFARCMGWAFEVIC